MAKMRCEATTYKNERCKIEKHNLSVHPETGLLVCGLHYPAAPPSSKGRPGLLRDGGIFASGRGISGGKQKQPAGERVRVCGYCGGSLYLRGVTVYGDSYNRELNIVAKRESMICVECEFEHRHVGATQAKFNRLGNIFVEGGFAPNEEVYTDRMLYPRRRYEFLRTQAKCKACVINYRPTTSGTEPARHIATQD